MDLKWQMAMLFVRVHKFKQKARRKIDFDKKESARFNNQKVRCYKCQQRGHFARECRAIAGNDKQRYYSFMNKEIGRKEEDSKALVTVDTLVDWLNHGSESDEVIAAKEFGMIAGANSEEANSPDDAGEFSLIGVTSKTKLDNNLVQNLYRLIDSSMSVRTKEGLGFTDCISKNEFGWDDSAFSVFTTTFEDVEGRPTLYRFAKTDSMKVVPPPLTGDYTSLSDHTDLDESQMFYGTKSSTSNDSESVTNDFVSCDDNDKSLKVKTSEFLFSDSSGKSSKHKPTDSTSCASTSSTEHTSSTSCNKRGSFNKKAGPAVRPQPVPTGKPNVRSVPTAIHGGKVTFRGGEGRITGKGTIRTPTLDFENVYYVKELQQFNLFSNSQICDMKNQVLFIDTVCLVPSKDFKLPDDSRVVLKVPRKHNLYIVNLNDLWPRGRQHKVSYKAINAVKSIFEPLQFHQMDLFGPTSIRSIDHKYYCLMITDDYSRFCWVFFLEHKNETYSTLMSFINLVENQLNKKVKVIRCDNGTEFKNEHMIELCGSKGIKGEYI
nr:hypothetical protein [Tanacetum cinerariifolium]